MTNEMCQKSGNFLGIFHRIRMRDGTIDCPEINKNLRIACEAQILKKCSLSYVDCWNLAIRCCEVNGEFLEML
ncbi:hypothetical protein Avbf_11307 [Armadillidium vulgare]|nr:hypothetical protein Avbf_11307 [Armadillidium vulgare]